MLEIDIRKLLHTSDGPVHLDIQLNLPPKSFTAIIGPSGSGKTTLLRIIAGLTQPEAGKIFYNHQCWLNTDQAYALKPQLRHIGMVFQQYALFPNMTVLQHLKYAEKKADSPSGIMELLEVMDLKKLENKLPSQLSGGQQQRLALARALASQPRLLLLDEPLTALDQQKQAHLQEFIGFFHQKYQLTTIMVSHNASDILKLAHQAAYIEQGKIQRVVAPVTTLHKSHLPQELQLIGEVFTIQVIDGNHIEVKLIIGENLLTLSLPKEVYRWIKPGLRVKLIRPNSNPELIQI